MIPNLLNIFNIKFFYEAERALPVDDHSFSKSICSLAVLDKGTSSETAFIKSFSISSLFSENEICIPFYYGLFKFCSRKSICSINNCRERKTVVGSSFFKCKSRILNLSSEFGKSRKNISSNLPFLIIPQEAYL